jgi:hypothetical protein
VLFGFVSSLSPDLEVYFSIAESAGQFLPSRRSVGPEFRFVCKVPCPHQVFLLPLKLQAWIFVLLFGFCVAHLFLAFSWFPVCSCFQLNLLCVKSAHVCVLDFAAYSFRSLPLVYFTADFPLDFGPQSPRAGVSSPVSQLLASTSVLVPWRQLRQGRTLVHFLTENRPGVRTGSVPSKPNSLLPVSDPRRLLLLLSPVSGIRRQVKRCCCPSFGFPILSVVCSVGLLSIVVLRSRYSSWVIGSKDSRFRGSNCTFAVVCRTRPPGVRWNVCGDINYFLSWFISSISYEVLLAPFCVFIVVASTVLRADSLTIARWSWPS